MFASNVFLELFAFLKAFTIIALAGWNTAFQLLAYFMHSMDLCLMSTENGEGCKSLRMLGAL